MSEIPEPNFIEQPVRALGLTEDEARAGQQRYGPNAVEATPPDSWVRVLLRQFRSLIVAVLGGAAIFSFAFHDYAEGYAILAVILINAGIGFWLEWNAQASMTALRRLGQTTARVLREGKIRAIPSDEVTMGDVLLVEAGEVVAADAQLFEAQQLQVNESTLTGESMPVSKALPATAVPPTEQTGGLLFKGTAVVNGTGRATVTGVGCGTQLGEIARLMQQAKRTATPLEAKLARLTRQLVMLTVGLAGLYVLLGLWRGKPVHLLLETAIVLAVAAIPEGMAIVATLALAYGMLRLAHRQVLVKRLAAVETLGSTDIIFTDKTGTLTQNQMAVHTVWLPEAQITFPPATEHMQAVAAGEAYQLLLRAAVLCNNATYSSVHPEAALGDPLEVALLALAAESHFAVADVQAMPRLAEQPFNSDTRLMATLHRQPDAGSLVTVKGAAEDVLRLCVRQQAATGALPLAVAEQAEWLLRAEQLAQTGLRTLALAHRIQTDENPHDLVRDLTWLGMIAFLDPARPEVIPAIEACQRAGIRVLMVTGDHPATALTVARQVHLAAETAELTITGSELAALLAQPAVPGHGLQQTCVFARVSPAQKLDLISYYQQQGHVVAMIGDGVNDAPALKKADIGVAMGLRGTQVASEAAALVLRDDSFASVVAAVEQGRIIFTNIRRFVLYLVSCNLSELLVVLAAGLAGVDSVLLPLQILFLNLLTDVFPALALSVGKGSRRVMEQPPHDPQSPMMRPTDWQLAGAYAALMTAALLGCYYVARHHFGFGPATATTILFYGLAAAQLVHVFNMAGSRHRHFTDNDVLRNRYVWLALALCTSLLLLSYYLPLFRQLLGIQPLTLPALLLVLVPAGAVLGLGPLLHRIFSWRKLPTRHIGAVTDRVAARAV
ncbi:cation-translocating P-type ATPase [Microvirga sp. STR05]|uniref:Cation-translocating P-type ATPase n=1 Tax=Hymenobacter duratus TaxID=2771356 RepID=A0ABR8JMQ0_9BACT|nr:cation-translocating P-type ATPase [Hymenobacter duratus]MBD2716657.1 cation-translocating P-type ATPase [Hymenobacter duratus]MBR7951572.1 cation-translocating P-type ATPase [Microvirga sp. STR05]